MTRYFYKDPLAAAWMAKHFGMRFAVNPQVIQQHFDLINVEFMDEDFQAPPTNGDEWLFFLHPDSLHVLEPVVGDMVTNIGMTGWKVTKVEGERVFCAHDYFGRKSEMSIIQRNGTAFMYPESEAA